MNGSKIISIHNFKNFFETYGFRRYFANTGWLFLGKMTGLVASFFVGAYVGRYLRPSGFGVLNYVFSFVGIFSFFSSLGIDNILGRELVRQPDKRDRLLGTAFVIKIVGSFLGFILILLITFLINLEPTTRVFINIFSLIFFFQIFGIIDLYFQSKVLSKNTVTVQIFSIFLTAIVKVIFIYLRLDIKWILFTYLLDYIITSLGLVIAYKNIGLDLFLWRFDKVLARKILLDSWPLMLAGAAVAIYSRIDQVMIGTYLNTESVGLYSAAVKLAEIWYFFPNIICMSVFPAIINGKMVSPELFESRLRKLYLFLSWSAILISIPISIFSNFFLTFVFGPDFSGAAGVLKIYVWASVPVFLSFAINQYLVTEGFTRISFLTTFSGMISNVILNIILIPRYGIMGAASATLISYNIASFSLLAFKKTRKHGIFLLKSLIFDY